MKRTLLFVLGGLLVGAAVHVAIVLMIPLFAINDAWSAVGSLGPDDAFHLMPPLKPGASAIDRDPEMMEAACRFDLTAGPVRIAATLPDGFWSVGLFDRGARNIYSFNHSSIDQSHLDLTIATPTQAAALGSTSAQNAIVAALQIDKGMAVLRVFAPDQASVPGITAALAAAQCSASS
jgi:uncharacterized membrane protein